MIAIPRHAIQAVALVTTKQQAETWFGFHCARVKEYEGQYWLEATDGKIAVFVRGEPTAQQPAPMPGELFEYLACPDRLLECAGRGDGAITLASDGKVLQIGTTNGTAVEPLTLARLPDANPILDGLMPMCGMRLSAKYLQTLAKISMLLEKGDDSIPTVRLFTTSPRRWGVRHAPPPVMFLIKNKRGDICEGLLMPVDGP